MAARGGQQGMLEWRGGCDSPSQMSPSRPPRVGGREGEGDGGGEGLERTRAHVRALASGEARSGGGTSADGAGGRSGLIPGPAGTHIHGPPPLHTSLPPTSTTNDEDESNDSTLLSPRGHAMSYLDSLDKNAMASMI